MSLPKKCIIPISKYLYVFKNWYYIFRNIVKITIKIISYLAPKLKAGARPRLDSGTKFPVTNDTKINKLFKNYIIKYVIIKNRI